MSGAVEQILARSRVTLEVNGVPYVVRRITAPIAIKVQASKAFGLIRGAMEAEKGATRKPDPEADLALAREYLAECMVSPKIGTATDPEHDTIEFADMDGDEFDLFAKLMEVSGYREQIADFPEPSEDAKD